MNYQDNFRKKYGIDAIDFVEKADLEYFGLAKTIGLPSVLSSYAEKIGKKIEFNDEFYKDLVEVFAEAGKRFPNNEKVTFGEEFALNVFPVNPSVPKSKGVLEDFKDIVSDNVLRPNTQCVYIAEDGYIVGTDAHKLIKYKSNEFSEYAGKLIKLETYIASKGRKLEFIDEKYVQYEVVIPRNNPNKVEGLSTYSFYNFTKSAIAVKKLLSDYVFNINFDFNGVLFSFNPIIMMDTLHFALCKGFEFFTLEYSTPTRAILMDFGNKSEGIVMPIMAKDGMLMGTRRYTIDEVNSDFKLSKTGKVKTSAKAPAKTTIKETKNVPYKRYEGSIDKTTYIPRRDISYVALRNGEQVLSSEIIDGFYRINKMANGGGVDYRIGDIFKGTPIATYEYDWQLYKPSTSYVIDNKTKKIVSIHNTPYEAIKQRDNLYPNFKLHYEVKPKEHYLKMENGGGVGFNIDEKVVWTYDVYDRNTKKDVPFKKMGVIKSYYWSKSIDNPVKIYEVVFGDGKEEQFLDKSHPESKRYFGQDILELSKSMMSNGGGVGDKISEIKAKIDKAKANKIMPENLKKQYLAKLEKELAELQPKKSVTKKTKAPIKNNTQDLITNLMEIEGNTWDSLNINSGTELKENDVIQKKYIAELDKKINANMFEGVDIKEVKDSLEDENYHSLNNYLGLKGYYGESGKNDYKAFYERNIAKGYKLFLNPDFFEKTKAPKKNRETKKQSKVSKGYEYIPQKDIEQIKSKEGTFENKDILDGAYIKQAGWKHKRK